MVPAKDLPQLQKNWQTTRTLLLVRQKRKPKLLQGFFSPVHFVAAMENIESTVPTDSQVMTKNKTFPLNHSLTCAN